MAKKPNYQDLSQELDTIIAALQQDDTDIDTALKQYQRGLELTKELETYLQDATNTITELRANSTRA